MTHSVLRYVLRGVLRYVLHGVLHGVLHTAEGNASKRGIKSLMEQGEFHLPVLPVRAFGGIYIGIYSDALTGGPGSGMAFMRLTLFGLLLTRF